MALEIDLSPRADRDLATLPFNIQIEVTEDLRILENPPWPGHPKVKKLKGKNLFRLRVGDYRCVFELWNKEKVVVHRIMDRKDFERIIKRM